MLEAKSVNNQHSGLKSRVHATDTKKNRKRKGKKKKKNEKEKNICE